MLTKRVRLTVLSILLAAAAFGAPPLRADHAATSGPTLEVPTAQLEAALSCPAGFANPGHEPVLLVHGTGATPEENWGWGYGQALPRAGYDTCTVRLPGRALGDIQVSSEYVVHAVRQIHARSGRLVDVVGHSQGGLQPRWAVKYWPDVQAAVDDVVTLGTPNHGTVAGQLCAWYCAAAAKQMTVGSNFLAALNRGDETPGAVSYTNIFTWFDQLVLPQLPASTSATAGAVNVAVQDVCAARPVEHVGLAGDRVVYSMVLDALSQPGGLDTSRLPSSVCLQGWLPGAGQGGSPSTLFPSLTGFGDGAYGPDEPPLKPYAN